MGRANVLGGVEVIVKFSDLSLVGNKKTEMASVLLVTNCLRESQI